MITVETKVMAGADGKLTVVVDHVPPGLHTVKVTVDESVEDAASNYTPEEQAELRAMQIPREKWDSLVANAPPMEEWPDESPDLWKPVSGGR